MLWVPTAFLIDQAQKQGSLGSDDGWRRVLLIPNRVRDIYIAWNLTPRLGI